MNCVWCKKEMYPVYWADSRSCPYDLWECELCESLTFQNSRKAISIAREAINVTPIDAIEGMMLSFC